MKIDKEGYDSDEDFSDSHKKRTVSGENIEDGSLTFTSDDEDPDRTITNKRNHEHMNPKSYSWCLMRYAMLKLSIANINAFLNVIGVEPQEIAIQSPLIHQVIKSFEKWSELLYTELNTLYPLGPPGDYIAGLVASSGPTQAASFNGPKILKYQSLLDQTKTPFFVEKSTFPVRRLWLLLVTRKSLYDVFIRHILLKSKNIDSSTRKSGFDTTNSQSLSSAAYKIVHKDQEAIYSFCLNERDKNVIAFCTSKDIIEVDMKGLMLKSTGCENECDIEMSLHGFVYIVLHFS